MNTTPAQNFAYITAERAAEVITAGTAFFTPEQLAGWYAFDAAREAGYGYEDSNLDAHLEFIRSVGAEFDGYRAVAAAREYAAKALLEAGTPAKASLERQRTGHFNLYVSLLPQEAAEMRLQPLQFDSWSDAAKYLRDEFPGVKLD